MANSLVISDSTLAIGEGTGSPRVAIAMDEDAFRLFYDRTSRPLWGYLARITGNNSAADDLLQETYYRFCRAAGTFESESHRRNSLFRIATNLARDAHRRQVVAPETQPVHDDLVESFPAFSVSDRADLRTDLRSAMMKLKPRQRELLWLAYANGSSHQEIAAVTGVTQPSVKSLLARARRALADLLDSGTTRKD